MLLERIKVSPKLEQIMLNFIDVLRINILLIDSEGSVILAPKSTGFGWALSSRYGVLSHLGTPKFLLRFKKEDNYLVSVDPFGFHTFAIPVGLNKNSAMGYLIVGPVILNKRLDMGQYKLIMEKLDLKIPEFQEVLYEIRVASFNSLKSILDLLFDLSQYALKINNEYLKPVESDNISVFTALLDLAMSLTDAECGSIMLFNQTTKELRIHVHKGIKTENLANIRIKLGEGIAGLAAQEKRPFIINDTEVHNRISHLLRRPELKCAVVLPILKSNKEVLGVMNMSTYQGKSRLAAQSHQMLDNLAKMASGTMEQALNSSI